VDKTNFERVMAGLEEAVAHSKNEIPLWTTSLERLPDETDEAFAERWTREAKTEFKYRDGRPGNPTET